jgi:two-component system, OmpR family, phosphate regulon response regulator PhoB
LRKQPGAALSNPQEQRYARDLGALEAQRHALSRRIQRRASPPSVLLADDDPRLRLLLVTTIQASGYLAEEAADGDQAWQLLQEGSFQGAILDVNMPGRDGFEVCQLIRADPQLQDLVVVILTAMAGPRVEARALALGADAYLAKPFSPVRLLETLDRLFQRGG